MYNLKLPTQRSGDSADSTCVGMDDDYAGKKSFNIGDQVHVATDSGSQDIARQPLPVQIYPTCTYMCFIMYSYTLSTKCMYVI